MTAEHIFIAFYGLIVWLVPAAWLGRESWRAGERARVTFGLILAWPILLAVLAVWGAILLVLELLHSLSRRLLDRLLP